VSIPGSQPARPGVIAGVCGGGWPACRTEPTHRSIFVMRVDICRGLEYVSWHSRGQTRAGPSGSPPGQEVNVRTAGAAAQAVCGALVGDGPHRSAGQLPRQPSGAGGRHREPRCAGRRAATVPAGCVGSEPDFATTPPTGLEVAIGKSAVPAGQRAAVVAAPQDGSLQIPTAVTAPTVQRGAP
jgi:hypothetical protein